MQPSEVANSANFPFQTNVYEEIDMVNPQAQFSQAALHGIDTAMRLTQIGLNSAERLFKLQFQTGRTLLEEQVRNLHSLAEGAPQELPTRVNGLAVQTVEQLVNHSRNAYEVLSATQNELTQLLDEQFSQLNRTVISSIDVLAKNAPAGTDAAVNALKSSIAASAAAMNSMTKAAHQVAEFTETSVKAATTATADAVKTAAQKVGTPAA